MTDLLEPTTGPARRSSVWHRLYHGETTYDFVGKRRLGYFVSGALLLATLVSFLVQGLNLGIDFEGGVSWETPSANLSQDKVESILADFKIDARDAKIQFLQNRAVGGGDTVRVQVPVIDDPATRTAIRERFAQEAGVQSDDVTVQNVSSTWGDEITKKAVFALVVFILLLSVYISWRFEWKMAIAAIAAMLHDVLISVGIYSLFQFTVTPATVIAFLTILGFSLYDTIVVFDKVHENTRRFGTSRVGYGDIVNLSMNQVLMRSLNTSIAAVLPVLSVLVVGSWIMGAIALTEFALALFVGLLTGSYSSIFIATPILATLKLREKKYAGMREKHASGDDLARLRTSGAAALTGGRSAGRAGATNDAAPDAARTVVTDPGALLTHPPRPRKKRRR